MYDYVWLCMTMYDYVWLCITMYDLRLVMMFIVETENKNPNVRKHDLQQDAKIKDNILNTKTTNIKFYIMYWLDFKIWVKAKCQIHCKIYLEI